MVEDWKLLQSYAIEGSEDAFRTLVERYVAMVYTAALRQTRCPEVAEEVTQAVFLVLARKAHVIRPETILAGWLFRTTRFAAARAVRTEQRRQLREQEAIHMNQKPEAESAWEEIEPILDEALAQLGETDRNAVLLRFFDQKDLKEVGMAIGSSEEAAKKRVSRALDKLRSYFSARGVTLSTTTLGLALMANAVQAAPTGLTGSLLASIVAGTGSAMALGVATIKTMFYAKLKATVTALGILLAIAGGGAFVVQEALAKEQRFLQLPIAELETAKPLSDYGPENPWSSVPRGLNTYGGIPFDVVAKLQLHGNADAKQNRLYPSRVLGIPVKSQAARLHVLHAGHDLERDGRPIAALRCNYSDGSSHTFFLTYGVHTRDWWKVPKETISFLTDSNSAVVWTGTSQQAERIKATHRIFKTSFDLPAGRPSLETVDVFSLFSKSSLQIFGLTIEQPTPGMRIGNPGPSRNAAAFRDELTVQVVGTGGEWLPGAKIQGVASDANGNPTVLGRLNDTFDEPGIVKVDFPKGAKSLHLAVSASGAAKGELVVNSNPNGKMPSEVRVELNAGRTR